MSSSGLPEELHNALAQTLGTEPTDAVLLGGGMINHAARVETKQGRVFVKWKADAPPNFFRAEADGLQRMQRAAAIRVPTVIAVQDTYPAFLVLDYIEASRPSAPARFAQQFGESLAAQHRNSVAAQYGLERDNFIGNLPQINTQKPDWIHFYRDCRILPQMEIARKSGRLPASRERLLLQVVRRMDSLLDNPTSTPALIHGDLWSGNFLSVGNEPVLIDPAVYYADRETEIAYMELFGGFPSGVLAAYREAYPLDPGYERRRALLQLYPLLVHLNHFGETYGQDVEAVCRQYL